VKSYLLRRLWQSLLVIFGVSVVAVLIIKNTGDTAALMTWLDNTSGQHWDPQRTIVITQYRNGDAVPLDYLSADHQVITTTPTNGERIFHGREDQSVAYIPRAE